MDFTLGIFFFYSPIFRLKNENVQQHVGVQLVFFFISVSSTPLTVVSTTPQFLMGVRGVAISHVEDLIEYYLILKFRFKISIDNEITVKIVK